MISKIVKKIAVIVVAVSCIVTMVPNTYSLAAQKTKDDIKDTNYDYTNAIYENGFEDTYLIETTDSVITTQTGIERTKPQVTGKYEKNYYPSPSNNVTDKGLLAQVLEESKELMANVERDIEQGTLKKHIAADGQYGGTLSEDAKAVEKMVYVNSNLKGGHSLAVYAPAGEIVTVTIPQEYLYLAQQGKLSIQVGLGYNADNVSNRMPRLGRSFVPKQSITKVGNPFGGMVYITLTTNTPDGLTIPVKVRGAVDTPYYDFGATTLEQWQQSKNAPGLYTEIRTPYMRMMLPSTEIRNLEDPYDILAFWTNVGALSTYPFGGQGRTLPITMIYDYYVFAGAAVATVGAWQCNFPVDWARNALNYKQMTSSGGWGNLHEFNHHWQGTYGANGKWGVGSTGEVTNNVINAAEYILYTNIAAYRTEAGIKNWEKVSDPYCNLKQLLQEVKNSNNPSTSVYMYTSFMHEFGVQSYLEVIKSNYSGGTYHGIKLEPYNTQDTRYDDLAYRTSVVMGKDLTYYFKDVLHFELSNKTIQKIKKLNFEAYLPIQNLYTAGVEGIETGRPFYIPQDSYKFDFAKYMASPGEWEIVSVGQPQYGSFQKNEDGTYWYQPKENIPDNAIDEYTLTVKLTAGGITQTRKLKGKIGFIYQGSKIEKYQIANTNTQQAIESSKTKLPYQTLHSTTMKCQADNGKNLTKQTGYFQVEREGNYEFQAYGDDKIFFTTTVGNTVYTSETTTYFSQVTAAYQHTNSTHFTVNLKAGELYPYELYVNNTGGEGWGHVAYRTMGETTWKNIADNQTYEEKEQANKTDTRKWKQPEIPYYIRPVKQLENRVKVDYSKASVLSTPNKQNTDGNEANAILDWNRNTFFHSRYNGGNITPFPHDYVIDLGEEKTFNKIDIYTRGNNTNGTIGDYQIYVSHDKTNWTVVAQNQNRKGNTAASVTISEKIANTNARYIKISALNNKNGHNFTIISSLELSTQMDTKSKIAQNSSKILYEGNWERQTDGNYINGATYNTTNGSMKYAYIGNQMAIYSSKDAVVKIAIDGIEKQYKLKGSKYEPSIILMQEENKEHKVIIQVLSGELGLNTLATNGIFIPYTKESKPESELNITSNRYQIEENTILGISPNTDIQKFKDNIQTNATNITFYYDKKEVTQGYIQTGMLLDLNQGNKQLTLVVTGDINGDGSISVVDLVLLKQQLVELIQLKNTSAKAADINRDGSISVVDLVLLKKALVGLIQL